MLLLNSQAQALTSIKLINLFIAKEGAWSQVKKKIAVIGGGAAGMMAAIQASGDETLVELYERNDRVGKKLLSTGNGKCNFSNTDMNSSAYYGSAVSYCDKLFSEFGVKESIDFFSQAGMLIKDRNGYLYPASEQASTVLDILRIKLEHLGVHIYTDCKVERIETIQGNEKLQIVTDSNKGMLDEKKQYDSVILACGGKAAPATGSDGNGFKIAKALGHHVTEVVPALVQLRCREDFFKSVAGVRTQADLTLYIDGESKCRIHGELQLTDYGISGIPVFCISREAAFAILHKKTVTVGINFLPQFVDNEYELFWKERWVKQANQSLEQFLTGIANKKINQLIIRLSGCRPHEFTNEICEEKRAKIAGLYRKLVVTVCKANGFEHAQVSAGGIPIHELTDELESKHVPHLYFAGEIIDMDGICGGYNLQWAWTSGAVAGRAARRT
ncbi:MAG: aminoacetone oxidase family FAD-binding enzyme [Lachnospiraceae bacterium]|nr:aminoacetone oxidase family FAD-binding enzyme [Lachnospiraceae bacterium]